MIQEKIQSIFKGESNQKNQKGERNCPYSVYICPCSLLYGGSKNIPKSCGFYPHTYFILTSDLLSFPLEQAYMYEYYFISNAKH